MSDDDKDLIVVVFMAGILGFIVGILLGLVCAN